MGIGSFTSNTLNSSSTFNAGSSFNLNSVSQTLGQSLSSTENTMSSFLQTMDPSNMDDLLQMQMYMVQWETTVQTTTSIYKGIGDTLKSVANNVGS